MSKKEAYLQKLQAQLDEWRAEIDKMKAKADQAQVDVRIACYKQIDELRAKQENAQKKLEDLRQAGDDAWENLKAGIEHAVNELGSAVKSAMSRFR